MGALRRSLAARLRRRIPRVFRAGGSILHVELWASCCPTLISSSRSGNTNRSLRRAPRGACRRPRPSRRGVFAPAARSGPHRRSGVPTHSVGRAPNSPHRDRGCRPTPSGGPRIHLTEIGGADPLRREGPEFTSPRSGVPTHSVGRAPNSPHRDRGCRPTPSAGPETASSQVHLARSLPPSMRSAAMINLFSVDALDGDGQLVSLRERLKGGCAQ